MTNNYFNNYQPGYGNPYMQTNPFGAPQQPFQRPPFGAPQQPFQRSPFGAPQQPYGGSFRNFNRMQPNFYNPQNFNNQQQYFNNFQQSPRQRPPIGDTFNMLAGHMGTLNNGVNMIRQMGSLLGLLR